MPSLGRRATGVLRRHQPAETHEGGSPRETAPVADFGGQRQRAKLGDAAIRRQPGDLVGHMHFCERNVACGVCGLYCDQIDARFKRDVAGKLLPVNVTGIPLQVKLETCDNPSERLPVALTVEVEMVAPSVGEVTVRSGGVSSILRVTVVLALFPDESVTVPVTS